VGQTSYFTLRQKGVTGPLSIFRPLPFGRACERAELLSLSRLVDECGRTRQQMKDLGFEDIWASGRNERMNAVCVFRFLNTRWADFHVKHARERELLYGEILQYNSQCWYLRVRVRVRVKCDGEARPGAEVPPGQTISQCN